MNVSCLIIKIKTLSLTVQSSDKSKISLSVFLYSEKLMNLDDSQAKSTEYELRLI